MSKKCFLTIYGNKLNELFIVIPTNLRKKLLQHLQKYGLDMLVLGGQGQTAWTLGN